MQNAHQAKLQVGNFFLIEPWSCFSALCFLKLQFWHYLSLSSMFCCVSGSYASQGYWVFSCGGANETKNQRDNLTYSRAEQVENFTAGDSKGEHRIVWSKGKPIWMSQISVHTASCSAQSRHIKCWTVNFPNFLFYFWNESKICILKHQLFLSQDLTSNSPYCLQYNSNDLTLENLVLN